MSEKHIGIIIQNQDKKILLYGDTCYIKVKINIDDDINAIIASKIKSFVDLDRFDIINTYIYIPQSKLVDLNIISDEEIIMYLVEVCIYHNEYDFIKTDDLLEVISNPSEREFFKENFVDYMMYKNSSQSFIFNNILTLFNLLVYLGFSIKLSETILLSLLILTVCMYYAIGKYIVPTFIKHLIKAKVSVSSMDKLNYLSFFLLAFVLIKTYLF